MLIFMQKQRLNVCTYTCNYKIVLFLNFKYYGDLCDTLWCAEKSNMRLCKTKRGRPLNGTPCSSGKVFHLYMLKTT